VHQHKLGVVLELLELLLLIVHDLERILVYIALSNLVHGWKNVLVERVVYRLVHRLLYVYRTWRYRLWIYKM
jgi:hypothetical protein